MTQDDALAVAQGATTGRRFLVLPGQHAFFYDRSAVKDALLKHSPRISNVQMQFTFPSTLTVSLEERRLAAYFQQQSRSYEVDADGRLFAEVASPPTGSIVLRDASQVRQSTVGDIVVSKQFLDRIIALHEEMQNVPGVTVVAYQTEEEREYAITAMTSEGYDLHFSSREDPATQVRAFQLFRQEQTEKNTNWADDVTYVDLRFGPTRVYYR